MNHENPEELIAQSPVPSQAEMEFRIDRVWERLGSGIHLPSSADLKADPASETDWQPTRIKRPMLRPVVVFACAVVAMAAAWFGIERRFVTNRNAYAIVENEDGARYRVAAGQIVATDVWTRLSVTLPDGSRVEMRPQSQLSVSAASDGLRVRLDKGGIIVTAARQRSGHLYVNTKDVMVSVVGTVFLVGVEDAGSRVGVLEGKVQVKQGESTRMLVPPGQMVTNPVMELPSLREQVAWSRYAKEHLALLQQDAAPIAAKQTGKPVQSTQTQTPPKPPQSDPPNPPAPRPRFEVASVKHNNSGSRASSFNGRAGRYSATNAPLRFLIQQAYKVQPFQIIGAPDWIDSERYDIEAKAEDALRNEQIAPMLQSLIGERFKAVIHGETRDLPVYFLTLAKNGSKLKADPCLTREPNTPVPPSQPQSAFCGYVGIRDGSLKTTGVRIDLLAEYLSGILNRKVLDRTGLAGAFDADLKWTPDISNPSVRQEAAAPSAPDGPSIFTAIEEQLGLKLESGKAPIDVLVIDHLDHASDN